MAEKDPKVFLPLVAMTLNNMGSMHCSISDYDSAINESQAALDVYRRLAEENPDAFLHLVAVSLFNVALLQKMLGLLPQAEISVRECLKIYTQIDERRQASFDMLIEKARELLDEIQHKAMQ